MLSLGRSNHTFFFCQCGLDSIANIIRAAMLTSQTPPKPAGPHRANGPGEAGRQVAAGPRS